MTPPFPLDLPPATALYTGLYVATLALHFIFVSYVLAGSIWIALDALLVRTRTAPAPGDPEPPARTLVDWMPFALGSAITAGVAPLLFLQVLHQQTFYTANLLLFPGWLAIIPVLVLDFYLLYLQKSRWIERRRRLLRVAVSLGALACVLFTAYSFARNHLLSLEPGTWRERYATGVAGGLDQRVLARLALWIAGSLPALAAALLWQRRSAAGSADDGSERRLARVALAGLGLALLAAGAVLGTLDDAVRASLIASRFLPWLAAAGLGVALQAVVWVRALGGRRPGGRSAGLLAAGVALSILGTVALREGIRLAALDGAALHARHEQAAAQGGFLLFLAFLAVNAALIAWSVRVVRTRLQA